LGGMKVENCARTAAGQATSNATISHRRSTFASHLVAAKQAYPGPSLRPPRGHRVSHSG
jgi:hypothetical protein